MTLDQPTGYSYLHPVSRIASFVVKGPGTVRVRATQALQVTLTIAETFETFFGDNLVDPAAVADEYQNLVPPQYAASYDPSGGNIVRENRFVRNLASVLNINPARIAVVNIVPGNRRRRLARADARARAEPWDEAAWVRDEHARLATLSPDERARRRLEDADAGIDVEWTVVSDGTSNATAAINATAASNATMQADAAYTELLEVSSTLTTAASSGFLDTGYTVTALAITLPEDACGVPGGNGSSCLDTCGVANGDGTSCLDACGVVNGDGTSCATTVDSGAVLADGGADFFSCANATSGVPERHSVRLVVADGSIGGMLGTFELAFNGEKTAKLSVFADAPTLQSALADLDAINDDVNVVGLMPNGATHNESSAGGVSEVSFGVEFASALVRERTPQNYGPLPLVVELDGAAVTNLGASESRRRCAGAYASGWEFAEQVVRVASPAGDARNLTALASAGVGFALALNVSAATSSAAACAGQATGLSPVASASELRAALARGLAGGSVGEDLLEVFETSTAEREREWLVRLYTASGVAITSCTDQGAMPAMLATATGLDVSARVATPGSVPASAMPVDLAAAAAETGASAAATEEATPVPAPVVEVARVCGDGIFVTSEGCDDGNLAAGDGCDANCTLEQGWVCSNRIGGASTCALPTTPTLGFAAMSFGPVVEAAGAHVELRILRLGSNQTSVSVEWRTIDSSATHRPADNNQFVAGMGTAPAGDYVNASGVAHFGPGERIVSIFVEVVADGVYDGDTNEKFAVVIANPSAGAELSEGLTTAFVEVRRAAFAMAFVLN